MFENLQQASQQVKGVLPASSFHPGRRANVFFLGSEINSEVHAKEAISARMCWGRAEAAGVNVSQASKSIAERDHA